MERRTHTVGECEIYKEERDALEEEMRKLDVCDMEEFGTLESGEKMIAILGDRWCKSVMSAQMLEASVSIRLLGVGMNGAPSRKGCVVNAQVKWSNE